MNTFWPRVGAVLACLAWLAGAPLAAEAQAAPPAGDETLRPVPAASHDPAEHTLLVMLRLPATHFRPDASYGGRYIDDSGRASRRRRAEELARQHGLTLVDDWPMPVLGLDCYVMRYPDQESPERIIANLARDPQVEWAQPVASFDGMASAPPAPATEGDALYPVQPAGRYWHVAELHRETTGRDIKVAVIDSGIDASHPDLSGQLAVNANFVDGGATPAENHGTAVAGIIAARAGNGGIVGVAPQAKLMGLRACWQQPDLATRCNSFTLGKAINYAILNGAQVINLSLAGPPDRLLDRLLDVALERGIGVVGAIDAKAAGPAFPANHRGVLAVASQPAGGKAAPAAGAEADPALLAPGNDIPTTAPGGRWSFVSGSSYAAAHVSGMLALMAQLQPKATPAQLRRLLQPGDALNTVNIDACATISRLLHHCSCSCTANLTQRGVGP
ncbi:peptidase S8 and S53 subtilisin kexin sedolisin [Duganella sp. BJB488]|uniref:S8 family peptidase n=1 Tax=unclassified Duganella TaxID=2636909 RepID=UPI000E34EC9C|nr:MULTISPECIES: S8 family serine peptidase [unclassified Duganella]RFP10358.1 peptidase S8 and S53 subtilisin kexin sedolisin [Duganella sp. BJB489]RFP18050.1 peptidase S8 and S53 subtilisin kexin sedolisin [Duganella sp. BJB488]RFP37805.1 peptidase S8 and S53 subtilisin kexin sedolisin [Duganella sp. BJB480]